MRRLLLSSRAHPQQHNDVAVQVFRQQLPLEILSHTMYQRHVEDDSVSTYLDKFSGGQGLEHYAVLLCDNKSAHIQQDKHVSYVLRPVCSDQKLRHYQVSTVGRACSSTYEYHHAAHVSQTDSSLHCT